jgi:pheromone shutdown protein TraB
MTPDPAKGQPLYIPPAERVSLDELKQRVGQIQDMALVQSKQVVREVYEQNVTRAVLVAVGVVVVAASIAYFLGTRASKNVTITNMPPV